MTYGIEIRNAFLAAFFKGDSINKIKKCLDICEPTLTKWKSLYKNQIDTKTFLCQKDLVKNPRGKSKLKNSKMYDDKIQKFVETNTGCTLEDIQKHINNDLANSTICKSLKRLNLTHKRIINQTYPKGKDVLDTERMNWANKISCKAFENFLYLDESSFCISDYKRYGYAKKGNPIQIFHKHKNARESRSLLMVVSKDRLIASDIFKGSINANSFLDFLKKNKYHLQGKNLFLDNATIHHAKIVIQWAAANNVKMVFNCPYSPDFNPIEKAFSKIKTEYRKIDHTDFENAIKTSVSTLNQSDCLSNVKDSFKHIYRYKFRYALTHLSGPVLI